MAAKKNSHKGKNQGKGSKNFEAKQKMDAEKQEEKALPQDTDFSGEQLAVLTPEEAAKVPPATTPTGRACGTTS